MTLQIFRPRQGKPSAQNFRCIADNHKSGRVRFQDEHFNFGYLDEAYHYEYDLLFLAGKSAFSAQDCCAPAYFL